MKQIANLYSFDAATRRVTIQGIAIPQARLLLIVNATLGQTIYNFAAQGLGASAYQIVSGDTIVTLASDTSAHSNTDQLTIYYEDGMNTLEEIMLADINSVAGAAPAPWLKTGGGNVPVVIMSGGAGSGSASASVALTEASGTAALSSTEVLVANTARKYLLIQNLSTAPLHLSFGGVASASSMRLDGGSSLCFENSVVATNAIRLLGTQAGQNYYIAHA